MFPVYSVLVLLHKKISLIIINNQKNTKLGVRPLLPFEDFMSILVSPGSVTGPSQGESSGGVATLMPLDLHAFL